MRIFRIGDSRHPIWDGTGAAMVGGRWNSPGQSVIYGSLSYSCAMLEILAHANIGRIPMTHGYVIAEVPDGVSIETHDADSLPPGWDLENSASARTFGDQWLQESRTAVLIVPSVIARLDANALLNPNHPDAKKLIVTPPEKIIWDHRLFEKNEFFRDQSLQIRNSKQESLLSGLSQTLRHMRLDQLVHELMHLRIAGDQIA